MNKSNPILCNCLYFTANALSRMMTRMADDEFKITGISPSHAFLLILVIEKPGIGPTELACKLQLTPSTVTRFLDKLVHKGLLERQANGRTIAVFATEKGLQLQDTIFQAWHNLSVRYNTILGESYSQHLTEQIDKANQKLEAA